MSVEAIDPKTLKTWLDKDEAFVIDVREPHEYHLSHILGATLIPLATLSKEAFSSKHPDKKLVIHCQHGKRGAHACERLLTLDPDLAIYHLEGGLAAWVNTGYPVTQ